jgi:hypothetical protein
MAPPGPVPQDFLRHWHVLVYVEGVIYEMDEHNERLAAAAQADAAVRLPGAAQPPACTCLGRRCCWRARAEPGAARLLPQGRRS